MIYYEFLHFYIFVKIVNHKFYFSHNCNVLLFYVNVHKMSTIEATIECKHYKNLSK